MNYVTKLVFDLKWNYEDLRAIFPLRIKGSGNAGKSEEALPMLRLRSASVQSFKSLP